MQINILRILDLHQIQVRSPYLSSLLIQLRFLNIYYLHRIYRERVTKVESIFAIP